MSALPLFKSEADFQAQLIDAAKRLGYRAYHTHDSRRSEPGFPDLVLASPQRRRVVFAELKSDTEEPSEDQAWWIDVLTAAGQETHVWHYRDWDAALAILAVRTRWP